MIRPRPIRTYALRFACVERARYYVHLCRDFGGFDAWATGRWARCRGGPGRRFVLRALARFVAGDDWEEHHESR
jgi:hypothetical protein